MLAIFLKNILHEIKKRIKYVWQFYVRLATLCYFITFILNVINIKRYEYLHISLFIKTLMGCNVVYSKFFVRRFVVYDENFFRN